MSNVTTRPRPGQYGKVIMVVDDDEDIRETVSEILRDEGYQVLSARNGEEALEQLKRGPLPVVILLDLMMPKSSGWDFVSEKQKHPNLTSIPVVIITADAHVVQKAASLESVGYLKKPFKLDELLQMAARF